ncbi:hypothetical protein CGZ90_08555 [Fictibacillus aquaticus]|uniref:DUF2624 domain-containing protein n=2 Tax=Fictibacillus aquaticus TaxID=2021314 RepID=A0A235FAF6_9BACL|nr:hypothetical protein CGZ90_08555 [Fictibacillus aquaticus]
MTGGRKMNPIMLHFINQKLNSITPQELMTLASDYQFPLSRAEAEQVVLILRRQRIDISNAAQRQQIIATIAREVSQEKANYIQYLINSYLDRK